MKQKKFWGILVAAVIAVTVLTAGCSGNGGETAGQTSREETIAETVKETTTAAETAKETTMEAASETGQTKEYKLPEKVILGALGTHPPYNYMEDDKLVGYEVDIWNEIAKRNGFELEYTTAQLSGLFGMLETGKIDTILSQITITDERKEKFENKEELII